MSEPADACTVSGGQRCGCGIGAAAGVELRGALPIHASRREVPEGGDQEVTLSKRAREMVPVPV